MAPPDGQWSGHLSPSCTACRMELVPTASCLRPVHGKGGGRAPQSRRRPFVTVPLPSVRSFCSIPGVCVWEGDWGLLRRSNRLGAGAPRPGLRVGASAGPGPPGQGSPLHWAFFPCLLLWSLGFPSVFMDVAAEEAGGEASWASGSETLFLAPSPAPWPGVQDFVICLCSCPKLFSQAGKVAQGGHCTCLDSFNDCSQPWGLKGPRGPDCLPLTPLLATWPLSHSLPCQVPLMRPAHLFLPC